MTDREFRNFANATGYITFAGFPPGPKNYAGALPHMLKAARTYASRTSAAGIARPRAMPSRSTAREAMSAFAALPALPMLLPASAVVQLPASPVGGKAYFRDGNANTVTSYGGQKAVSGKTGR